MAVDPVQNNNTSYAKAAAFGVVGGYAAKHIIPVTETEIKDVFESKLDEIKITTPKSTLAPSETTKAAKSYIKATRPAEAFVFIGLILGLLYASFKNMRHDIVEDAKAKPNATPK